MIHTESRHADNVQPLHAKSTFPTWDDTIGRAATRRAFVALKERHMRAAADIDDGIGDRLRWQVRQASDSTELWRLRAAILQSLRPEHPRTLEHRRELQRGLDNLFGWTLG